MKLEHIFKEHEFTEAERIFMNESGTANTADMNQPRVVSELILGKRIEKSSNKVIEADEKLAAANQTVSKRMLFLTIALVGVGLVQIVIHAIEIWKG